MEIKEAELFINKLEELLKEEEKLTKMYFDLTILASHTGAQNTHKDMNNIGEIVGAHQSKTKQLIGNFKASRMRIIKTWEARGGEARFVRPFLMEMPKVPETKVLPPPRLRADTVRESRYAGVREPHRRGMRY